MELPCRLSVYLAGRSAHRARCRLRAQLTSARASQARRDRTQPRPLRRHTLVQRLEAGGVAAFLAAMGVLPLDLASAAGGAIARIIGPHLAVTRRAQRNLDIPLPHFSAAARRRFIPEMLDNSCAPP